MSTNVYGLFLPRAGGRLAARCADYDVDASSPILLVMACETGPQQLASAIASWGERPLSIGKDGTFDGIVLLRAAFLTEFASQYPNRLIAKVENGLPPALDADGNRPILWADLGVEPSTTSGVPHAHAS